MCVAMFGRCFTGLGWDDLGPLPDNNIQEEFGARIICALLLLKRDGGEPPQLPLTAPQSQPEQPELNELRAPESGEDCHQRDGWIAFVFTQE